MKELNAVEIDQVAGAGVALSALVQPVGGSAIPSDPIAASAYLSGLRRQALIKQETAEMLSQVASKI